MLDCFNVFEEETWHYFCLDWNWLWLDGIVLTGFIQAIQMIRVMQYSISENQIETNQMWLIGYDLL